MQVKFIETRRIRKGNVTTVFRAGEKYDYDPVVHNEFVEIGHALFVTIDEPEYTPTEGTDAPRPRGRPRLKLNLDDDRQAIYAPEPERGEERNGGFTEV